MSDSMRDNIIQVLLSTRSMSEGDTADALLSLLAAQPPAQAEPAPDTEQCQHRGVENKRASEWHCMDCGKLLWSTQEATSKPNSDSVNQGGAVVKDDTEQQRRDAELQRLRAIEHHAWHLFDDMCDDGSEVLTIDKRVSAMDLDALHVLLPEDHPDTTQAAIEAEGRRND